MRQICAVFFVIAFSSIASECLADEPNKIFGNMTYMIGNENCAERAHLVDGKYEVPRIMYVYYENQYVYGDFNSDGLEDAAVIIAESGGGSGHFRQLAFLINKGGKFIHRSSAYLGDRVIINSIKENKGSVILDMFVHAEDDCRAGPSVRTKNIYKYTRPTNWGPDYQTLIKK